MQQRRIIFSTDRTVLVEIEQNDNRDLLYHFHNVAPTPDYLELDEHDTEKIIKKMIGEQVEVPRTVYRLGILDKNEFCFIGIASIRKIPGMDFFPDIGLSLNSNQQGKGLGTEVYRALIDFTFKTFPADMIVQAKLNPANIPSLRMHFNCGMHPFCFVKNGFIEGDHVEDDLSMRITRAFFERNGAKPGFMDACLTPA